MKKIELNNEKPSVLLLYPKTGMDFGSTVAPPHACLAIAAPVLKAGYSVELLDQRTQTITKDTLENYLCDDTICVGISTMTGTQINNALNLAKLVREITDGKIPLVWGGCHPSVMPKQTLENENVDIVAVGEADDTFLEIVKAIDQKNGGLNSVKGIMYKDGSEMVTTAPRPLLDVDTLLPTPWHLVDVENYIHRDMYLSDRSRVLDVGQSSRGCPFNCGFCSSAEIRERKWRAFDVERSLDYIEHAV